jgi:predicted TIM-barrel fold metal-dependent hydrolase
MRMLSRRDALIGSAAAAAALVLRREASLQATASQPATPVKFDVPAGACDCHAHVFGNPDHFPFDPARAYTPEPASIDEMRALHKALRTDRVVIIQPSVYGTNNACTLDAIRQLGSRAARGVAVIDETTSEEALDEMHRGGIRGIRLNLEISGQTDPLAVRKRFNDAVTWIQRRPWHIQIYTQPSVIAAIKDDVASAPVPVVFDHFGGAQAALGAQQDGLDALMSLVGAGLAYVKISAPYRSSTRAPDYLDLAPMAKAMIAANPQHILWGTDWPHPDSSRVAGRAPTDIAPLLQIDDGRVFNQLAVWAPDALQRKIILVDNPAKLYGF